VEYQNYLGIYIGRKKATVVCLGPQKKEGGNLKCFSVSAEEQQQDMQSLAGLIAQGCAERNWKFSEVTVALDCSMFMQHSVHSEFSEPKQIAVTVRFDTEEALATDITNVAVAFEIASIDQTGSRLTVFTSERKILSEILDAMQQYDLDPINIEPDVNCLSRFIGKHPTNAESRQTQTLYGLLSHRNGYLIAPSVAASDESRKASIVRTFLLGASQDRTMLLQREVLVTNALIESTAGAVGCLKVFDSAGSVSSVQLADKLGIETDEIDLRGIIEAKLEPEADFADPVDVAIAYGAALTLVEKDRSINFRDDFSPFQGKKVRQRKTLKTAAISVTILLVAVGLYFQTQLFSANRNKSNLRSKFAKDYAEVTLGKLPNNFKIKDSVRDIARLLRRIEDEKKGLSPTEKSIASYLTQVLAAFNKCAAQTNLNIDTIVITTKDIMIMGDTSNRQSRQRFFETIRNSGLDIKREGYSLKNDRESFRITIEPKT
jgi:hypothetical protein